MDLAVKVKARHEIKEWYFILAGCALLVLGSCLRIPFYPVSFTMQTCTLFILALTLTPKQALQSTLLYLGLATAGAPVFGGLSNPMWLTSNVAGFLIAFPIAAYIAASFKEKNAPIAGIVLGHGIIYLLGFIGLMPILGAYNALVNGVMVFIPSDFLKAVIAYSGVSVFNKVRNELFN